MKKTILVVDDETGFREMISFALSGYGFNILTAGDGAQAVEQFKDHHIDFIITDMKMPKMDGLDVISSVKEINADIPVVIMTGFAIEERVQKALGYKAVSCLRKPFNIKELHDIIQKSLGAIDRQ